MSNSRDDQDTALEGALTVGAALRQVRMRQGRSLQDLSDATKIKRAYLEAIEEMRLDELPSRPFTIGYVRAYARALDLDGDAAAARFKQDAPGGVEPLRPPVGVRKHKDARLSLLAGGGAVVISAVLLWNLAQHAMADDTPPPPVVADAPATTAALPPSGTVSVSAAMPAPQESTLPTPYQTPGLEVAASDASATDLEVAASQPAAAQTFQARGAVFGAPAAQSVVTLQARKATLLVIHGPDGTVLFARQLKDGEAYRAPTVGGLTIDASEPGAFDVYVAGQIHDPLTGEMTPLSRLADDAAKIQAQAAAARAAAAPQAALSPPAPARKG